ncbi:uncharacterized protein LOC118738582 [Rhagoletis pomonella]|uniref:uncharacterized protein LOC118738582 n=1 Tax=Rhagoletis pomonella TaxID=28610 RepID=UPI001784BA3A|nr:uncharacterized protein LOC118738582 [Rhagoletis pomonella]
MNLISNRSKGGLNDHPDRQQFKYRLRSYIVGFNEGVLSDSANVSIDDTPDIELESNSLTGIIFNKVLLKSDEGNEESSAQEEQEVEGLENDGLEIPRGISVGRCGVVVSSARFHSSAPGFKPRSRQHRKKYRKNVFS